MNTPHCTDSEAALLSNFLFQPDSIAYAIETLTEDHFFDPHHKIIWAQIRKDFIAQNPVNIVDMHTRLRDAGLWNESIQQTIAKICERSEWMLGAVIQETVESLDSLKTLRAALIAQKQVLNAFESLSLPDTRRAAQTLVESLAETKVTKGYTLHQVALEACEVTGNPKECGLTTGFQWLDSKIGGLQAGRLFVIAAPRGGGKSAFVLQMVWNLVKQGHHCTIYSREMTRIELFQRICCLEGVSSNAWTRQTFNNGEMQIIARVAKMKDAPLRIYDDLSTIEEIAARIRLDVIRFKTRVVIVDYIQLVRGDRKEGREREVSGIAWQLKELALSLGITILAPSQLNNDMQARESRDIENHSDQMLIIAKSNKEDEEDSGKRLLKITKNRNGESDCRCIYQFTGKHYSFAEVEETDADITPAKQYRQQYAD